MKCQYCGYQSDDSEFLEGVCPACVRDIETGEKTDGIATVFHNPIEPIRLKNTTPAPMVEIIPAAIVARLGDAISDARGLIGSVARGNIEEASTCAVELSDGLKQIESRRKEVKAPFLEMGKLIDAAAKNASADADETLRALKSEIVEAQKKEGERVAGHLRAISGIHAVAPSPSMTAEQLEAMLDECCDKYSKMDFEEFAKESRDAVSAMRRRIHQAIEARKAADKLVAEAEAERKRKEAEDAELAELLGAGVATESSADDWADRIAAQEEAAAREADRLRAEQQAQAEAARHRAKEIAEQQRKASVVQTRKRQVLVIDDPRALAAVYEVAGAVLVKIDEAQVLRLLKAGVQVPHARLVAETVAAMSGRR